MKVDHYQSAATITAALISERATFGERTSKEEAIAMYVELVSSLNQAVKFSSRNLNPD